MKGMKDMKKVFKKPAVKKSLGFSKNVFIFFMLFMVSSLLVSTQQKPPVFRARTDLIQLDVVVLDKDGKPVRGLTQNDFTVFEDKDVQRIEGFNAVDLEDVVHDAGPVWEHKVPADVVSNEFNNQRIFVLVVDDGLSMGLSEVPPHNPDQWAIKRMKESVALFISQLNPDDKVALFFTQRTKLSQDLTSDHERLIKAVQAFPDGGAGDLTGDLGCLGARYAVRGMKGIIEQLATIPDRRKAIVYFGGELPRVPLTPDQCGIFWDWREVFAAADQAHVTVNPVDTMGLRLHGMREEYLTVAENTGGRAIVNTNDFAPGIHRIFVENSSYYLLAYSPTHSEEDGTFRRIRVTVNGRPDLEVSTRRSYWAPKAVKDSAPPPPPPPPDVEALSGILPLSKLALRVTAAPFAAPGGQAGVVTLAVGVKQPAFANRTAEQIELLVKAYTADGDPKGSDSQMVSITVPAARADSEHSRYDVLAKMDIPKPGKYEIRLSAHSTAADTRGSVYVDFEVPDFRKEKVSLSGVVLNNALPLDPVAPARLLRDIVPVTPTSERSFTAADVVTAFMRVYQGGSDKLTSVPIKIQIQDEKGQAVFDRTETLKAESFRADRATDYQFRLPLSTLAMGEYLLTFEASAGKTSVRRNVRFQKSK